MDVPHVDAMDDPPVRTPARIGVLNQGAYPLLHPPPHADPDLEYPTRVQSPTSATTGAPTGAACSCSVSEFPPRGLGRGLRFLPRPCALRWRNITPSCPSG